ncbi:hypothetical protein D3H54_08195 [Mycobacterium sp. ELW1]|nr:hypothetical protein D3H54_08195 [Mycobacterium sp. ELW1]
MMDQAFYAAHRAAGQKEVMQVGWVYERAVDLDGLRKFHQNLSGGLLGRLIEGSPLPFGRDRWVTAPRLAEIEIAPSARPRAELGDWLDECTQLPLDPESGPGFRLSVLPLADGSTAISLVLSHYVIDGIGAAIAVSQAAFNMTPDLGYPPPHSRSRLQAAVEDVRGAARDAPAVARALVAAVKEARRRRNDATRPEPQRPIVAPTGGADGPVTAPSMWIQIPLDEWNARVEALGGTNSALAAAFTARLDQLMGRRHGDSGEVTMLMTVNNRTGEDDLRAVAVSFARVNIDPTGVTTNLRAARNAIRDALKTYKESQHDESDQFAPLTPFTPQRAWRQMVDYGLNDPEQPSLCTNLGDTGPAAIRPDGTLCSTAFARGASQHLTQHWLEKIGSQLHVYFGTAVELNKVGICICAYHPDSVPTKAALRELAAQSLAEFGLTGEMN